MTYFSLLYQNQLQENIMKEAAKKQLYIVERKENERKFHFIGNKMVRIPYEPKEKKVPSYFVDLNIHQLVDKILLGDTNNELLFAFHELIRDKTLVNYRQNIFRDLDKLELYEQIAKFKSVMSYVLKLNKYSKDANSPLQKSKYLLDSMYFYQENINNLIQILSDYTLSDCFSKMHQLLKEYFNEKNFTSFKNKVIEMKKTIDGINYTISLKSDKVRIIFDDNPNDFSKDLRCLLKKTNENQNMNPSTVDSVKQISFFNQIISNDLELKIIEILEKQYPALFKECMDFTSEHINFMDDFILRIYKEMYFYLYCHDFLITLKAKKYNFTYPEITDEKDIELQGLYDLSLALKECSRDDIVVNNFNLKCPECGTWVTGANQGGKTTYARSIGQIAYLAAIGLPVPADYARLPLFHGIYTHFTIEENAISSNGKLKEELLHLKDLLNYVQKGKSLFILNELFSSSTSMDSYELSLLLMNKLIEDGCTIVCVTHIPKLAQACPKMVSIATQIDHTKRERTYRFIRKGSELTAYADDIAVKFQLTFEKIKERLGNEV